MMAVSVNSYMCSFPSIMSHLSMAPLFKFVASINRGYTAILLHSFSLTLAHCRSGDEKVSRNTNLTTLIHKLPIFHFMGRRAFRTRGKRQGRREKMITEPIATTTTTNQQKINQQRSCCDDIHYLLIEKVKRSLLL